MNAPSAVETLAGRLEHITFRNSETHYTVARLREEGTRNPVTVVGTLAGVSPGETLRIRGRWEQHPRFGRQLRVGSFEVTLPATVDGIRAYLQAGVITGIGAKTAARLIEHFGADTLGVIETDPGRLREVPGIGATRAARIRDGWREHHALRTLMQFLQRHGVPSAHAARAYRHFGSEAVEIIRADPYCLAREVPGCGFETADRVARSLGVAEDDPTRVQAGIRHLVARERDRGHTWAAAGRVMEDCAKTCGIDPAVAEANLNALIAEQELVGFTSDEDPDHVLLMPAELYAAEVGISRRLAMLAAVPPMPAAEDGGRLVRQVAGGLAIEPSEEQLEILDELLFRKVLIVTGGPGTGKTTLVRAFTTMFETLGRRVLLAAPTGRAARRLAEVSGRPAATIHRMLGFNLASGVFGHNEDDPLEAEAIIVDEASMIDLELMHHLLRAIPLEAALILVGDVFQLPSVGPGNVLRDMIDSGTIAKFDLTHIYRQAAESPIVANAHRVRRGRLPQDGYGPAGGFTFIEENDPRQAVRTIVALCRDDLPARWGLDPVRDIQVLTPMHRGEVGTVELNRALQAALNPHAGPAPKAGGASRFRLHDKVMHLRNNYAKEVFNGDIGRVMLIEAETRRLRVDYEDRVVPYDFDELDELSLAYAISVHKSQGSEYPVVVLPLFTQHYPLLQRNLLYTAVTRARRQVAVIGMRRAMEIAVANDRPHQRHTYLAKRLAGR